MRNLLQWFRLDDTLVISGGQADHIRTDHDALCGFLKLLDASEKLMSWRLHLSEFKFDFMYQVGIKIKLKAHFLVSRLTGVIQPN